MLRVRLGFMKESGNWSNSFSEKLTKSTSIFHPAPLMTKVDMCCENTVGGLLRLAVDEPKKMANRGHLA